MADTAAIAKEFADWTVQNFPLSGADVLNILINHKVLTVEECEAAIRLAMDEHDVEPDSYQSVTCVVDDLDDVIPF